MRLYCHIWNQQPLICHKGVFEQYSEFWHRVRFFYRSGSAFSKGPLFLKVRFINYAVWSLTLEACLEPSRTFYNGAFSRNIFFWKIYKKTPVLESHFNKATGVYPPTSLKEGTPTQVFSSEFCEILKTPYLQNTSR